MISPLSSGIFSQIMNWRCVFTMSTCAHFCEIMFVLVLVLGEYAFEPRFKLLGIKGCRLLAAHAGTK
jgi:hypothetical protein